MINLGFFPSRRIALYMAKTFLVRSLAILFALVLVLQALDLLGESGKILAQKDNHDAQLWYYVSLRLPQLVARFLPFAILLGTLVTLATLNQNSEIISMKAAGISAHQIIAPLIVASLGVAALAFAFQERVVTRASATLDAWQAVDYGHVQKGATGANVWVRHGDDLILAHAVAGAGAATRLQGVSIYQRSGGTLVSIVTADSARPAGTGWLLDKAVRFDVARTTSTKAPRMRAMEGVEPRQFTLAEVDADEQDFASLRRSIGDLDEAGMPAGPAKAGLWHKISQPLSAALMPLLAAIAAFGLARSGRLFLRAVIGMALGFAYFVVDSFAMAMGNLGAYPPLLAAWAPFLLFLLIGETVLIRTEE